MSKLAPIKLAYKVFEPISKENNRLNPVIFLPGLIANKDHFMDIPQHIADKTKRKAYSIDARNHGDSEYTNNFNFDLNVDDLFHFMDTINIPKAVLVGHSMGAITAIRAALRKPEKVEILFSEDTYSKVAPKETVDAAVEFVRCWTKSVEEIPKDLSHTEAVAYAVDYMTSNFRKNFPSVLREIPSSLKRSPEGVYKVAFNKDVISKALENSDTLMTETNGQFDGPAYFIYGSHSPYRLDKEEEDIKKYFPRMKLIKIEGATHGLHFQFPGEFTETILRYL